MAILDAMDAVKPDISTIAIGLCASTATLLLVTSVSALCQASVCDMPMGLSRAVHPVQAAGTKGKRFSMPSTRIMMHQPSGVCRTCIQWDLMTHIHRIR